MIYGPLVAPTIGVVMEELVRRAVLTIRSQRFSFKVETKLGHSRLNLAAQREMGEA